MIQNKITFLKRKLPRRRKKKKHNKQPLCFRGFSPLKARQRDSGWPSQDMGEFTAQSSGVYKSLGFPGAQRILSPPFCSDAFSAGIPWPQPFRSKGYAEVQVVWGQTKNYKGSSDQEKKARNET